MTNEGFHAARRLEPERSVYNGSDDIITALSRTDILNLCIDLPIIDNEFCGRVTRDQNQVVMWVDISAINAPCSPMIRSG